MTESTIQKKYTQELKDINSQAGVLLDKYVERYPFYKTYPQYNEYQALFFNVQNQIKKNDNQFKNLHMELSEMINGGDGNINNVYSLADKIAKLEEENPKLERKVNFLKNNNNASSELTSEYKEMFNIDLIYTLGVGSGIVLLGFFIGKTLHEKNIGSVVSISSFSLNESFIFLTNSSNDISYKIKKENVFSII